MSLCRWLQCGMDLSYCRSYWGPTYVLTHRATVFRKHSCYLPCTGTGDFYVCTAVDVSAHSIHLLQQGKGEPLLDHLLVVAYYCRGVCILFPSDYPLSPLLAGDLL